jgi:hypothetical protein
MNITIENKKYSLEFGFGFLRKFGERRGFKSYQDTIKYIVGQSKSFENLDFEQEDMLQDIIYCAALQAKDKNAEKLLEVDVLNFMLKDTKGFNSIIEELAKSLPQETAQKPGKKQPRKTARK